MSSIDILFKRQNKKSLIAFCLLCLGIVFILHSLKAPKTDYTRKDDLIRKVQLEKQHNEQLHKSSSSSLPHVQVDSDVLPVIFPDPFEYNTPEENEKYITYLPHSGFHNQRIELENALLLATYLNRTLLLPSVYLGNPAFPWLRFDKMYERLLLQTKQGLEYCSLLREGEPVPSECLNYARWTAVPWTFFYDFKKLREKVRIMFRPDLSLEWMKENLGLKNGDDDIYLFKDNSPFEFRVYDLPESRTPLSRFVNRIELSTLEAVKERVIHFGSVFGSYRVLAQSPENMDLLVFVRENMIFQNPTLIETAKRVVEQLGGVGTFVGLHLRVGDGLFKVRASITIDDIYHQLVNEFTDLTVEEVAKYEDGNHDQDRKENLEYEIRQLRETQPEPIDEKKPIIVEHPINVQDNLGTSQIALCQNAATRDGRNDRFARTTIFIATDCPDPSNHPLLRKIYKTFPCVLTLGDFKKELSDLSKIQVVEERVKLESYLIPMVDAIIASQGHTFYGTNSSTFSTYIERQLHPIYTNQQIVLNGAPLP